MFCGVKFCGGCNPRYDRGIAFDNIKQHFKGFVTFEIAKEDVLYDLILVIGGCTKCCASYCQYKTKNDIVLMWDEKDLEQTIKRIEEIGGIRLELERNI